MLREESIKAKWPMLIIGRIRDYSQLLKPNLSFMVVFSSVIGYLLAPNVTFAWDKVLILFIGGIMVTCGANTINQIIERDGDALMKRTMNRPLPDGRISVAEAWIVAITSGIAGVSILTYFFNPVAGALSLLSLLLYAFAYTPMKRVHPVAVLIGAIPGAFPPLLGWVAATGSLGIGGWILFLIQFFWQFPHYWAIGWVGYDEYKKAGISMLPSQERTSRFTGLQCMFYSLVLIPMALMPRFVGLSGNIGMIVAIACGIMYFAASFVFYKKNDHKAARRVMFSSFIYLPIVLLALLFDKM